jgi:anti-sigma factor RsiW
MARLDHEVAGIRCREVLAELSDYLDGELADERVEQINAHLRGCDNCARFGGRFQAVFTAIREVLAEPAPLDDDVQRSLHDSLRREIAS